MNKGSFNIGNIKIKVKTLFYGLLTLSVICSFVISIANALKTHSDIFTVLTSVVIFTLCAIGLIAIILEAAKKWRYVVGITLAGFALYIIFSLPAGYNFELGVFFHSPIMIALQLTSSLAWLMSGILIIINKNIFKKDDSVSSGLSS